MGPTNHRCSMFSVNMKKKFLPKFESYVISFATFVLILFMSFYLCQLISPNL